MSNMDEAPARRWQTPRQPSARNVPQTLSGRVLWSLHAENQLSRAAWPRRPPLRVFALSSGDCRPTPHSANRRETGILDEFLATAHNVRIGRTTAASRALRRPIPRVMLDFIRDPSIRSLLLAAFWFAAILALLALAIVIVRRFRGGAADDQPQAGELLSKFREVHSRGGLSDDEYRTIKTKLAADLQSELNDTGETT